MVTQMDMKKKLMMSRQMELQRDLLMDAQMDIVIE
jgi:hypothetical protein